MYCILYSKVCSNTYMYPGSWADATAHTLYVVLQYLLHINQITCTTVLPVWYCSES